MANDLRHALELAMEETQALRKAVDDDKVDDSLEGIESYIDEALDFLGEFEKLADKARPLLY